MKMHICQTQPSLITHKLKPKRRIATQSKSSQKTKITDLSSNHLLSSVSPKLYPSSIEISAQNRISSISFESDELKISCMDKLLVPNFVISKSHNILDFQQLRRKGAQKKLKNWFSKPTCSQSIKRICIQPKCLISQRWMNQIIDINKEIAQADKIRTKINQIPKKQSDQIQKDILRSFPDKSINKTKLTVYQTQSDKKNIFQMLKIVLKMLWIDDPEVGYVQGMNLYAAVIVSHIKDINRSFIFIKEIMKYGQFRKLYIDNFEGLKQKAEQLLHRHIKLLMRDLYEQLMNAQISSQIFMPFYLSMFAFYVEYKHMHVIIDQFLQNSFGFLDKLVLSLLCYLQKQLLKVEPEQINLILGSSYMRQNQLPWQQIINLTQAFQLN